MNQNLNALEQAVLEDNEPQIIHSIKEGLRVSHLDVLGNVENIKNENARYILIKYGIAESELDKVEPVLAKLTDVSGCSETLMIFQSDESLIFRKSRKAGPYSVFKNAIAERNIRTIKECLDRNEQIMELDTITFSMALAGYTDKEVRWLFEEALTKESRCYFMMKLIEAAKSFGKSQAGKTAAHYADILEDMLAAYTSEELEQAVRKADDSEIIIRVIHGESLTKPELLASKKFFSKTSIRAAMFLFERGITKSVKQQAILLLQKKYEKTGESWIREEIELLEDSMKPFPAKLSADERMLEKAIRDRDDQKVMELIENNVRIRRPDVLIDLSFTRLSAKTMIAVATRAADLRISPHVYWLHSCIVSYTEYSGYEYFARIMVQNLFLEVDFRVITWENHQHADLVKNEKEIESLRDADLSKASKRQVSSALKCWKKALSACPVMVDKFDTRLLTLAEKQENWDDVRDLFNAVPALFDTKAFSVLDDYSKFAFLRKYPDLYDKINLAELASTDHMKVLAFCESISEETAKRIDWSVLGCHTFAWVMFLNVFPQLKDRCNCFGKFSCLEWMLIHHKEHFQEEIAKFVKKDPVGARLAHL